LASSPTLRRRRLSAQLHMLRLESGLTAEAAAREAKAKRPDRPWSAAKVVRIENREWKRLQSDDVLTLLDVYKVTDKRERDAFVRLALEASQSGWWVGYRDILGTGAYVDLETEASRIRTYQALAIPGLLQTEEYARAIIRGGGVTDDREIERRVEARMMRQHRLSEPDAPHLWAVVDEAAFHRIPAELRAEQLRHLIDVQRPTLRVQVLPYEAGLHAGTSGSFVLLDFSGDPSVVYLEHSLSGLFPEDPAEVEHYATVFDVLQAQALSVDESLAWMGDLLRQTEGTARA